MIYLIGGSMRTGKSRLANKILRNKQTSVISTDVIIELLKDYVEKDSDDLKPKFIQKAENFYPHLKALIRVNLNISNSDYVYEGDIILPKQVNSLSQDFDIKSCFLGFSDINVETLKQYMGDHRWLERLSEDELSQLPQQIIDMSKFIEEECSKYNFKYFDLSADYDKEHELAYQYLTKE